MEMKSKIKKLFDSELRHYIAAICDTRRIENNQQKMDLVHRFLITKGISFEPLGGATNRYVVMVDGYAVKIAIDRQGFKDNLMEYSLSDELQPYATKSYETNGYILMQECVRILTVEEWRVRKPEILKILDILGGEYLLGDVGYYDVNMTNWGMRDNGDLVILDYAYCHRLSEDLFICPVCGSLLTYDQNFVHLLCTDRANCHEKYTYNQIKAIQGETIDWDTINERKHASVHIPEGLLSVQVETDANKLLDSRTMVIRSYQDLAKYNKIKKEEENMLKLDLRDEDTLSKMLQITNARIIGDDERVRELEKELYGSEQEAESEPVRCVIDPEFQERMDMDAAKESVIMQYGYDYDPDTGIKPKHDETPDDNFSYSLGDLMNSLPVYNADYYQESCENVSDESMYDIGYQTLLEEDAQKETQEDVVENHTEPSDDSNSSYTDEPIDYMPEEYSDYLPDEHYCAVSLNIIGNSETSERVILNGCDLVDSDETCEEDDSDE